MGCAPVRALGQACEARIRRVLTFLVIFLPYKGTNLARQSPLCTGFVNEKSKKVRKKVSKTWEISIIRQP